MNKSLSFPFELHGINIKTNLEYAVESARRGDEPSDRVLAALTRLGRLVRQFQEMKPISDIDDGGHWDVYMVRAIDAAVNRCHYLQDELWSDRATSSPAQAARLEVLLARSWELAVSYLELFVRARYRPSVERAETIDLSAAQREKVRRLYPVFVAAIREGRDLDWLDFAWPKRGDDPPTDANSESGG